MRWIDAARLLASLPFLASMCFTPGPNNILLAGSGVNFGWRATVPHMLGVIVGTPLMLLSVGLGLAGAFRQLPQLHQVLKYLCIIYLAYLAWRIATAAAPGTAARSAKPLTFSQAVMFQWVNGKAWVTALSAVATYTVVSRSLLVQVVVLASLSMVVTIGSVGSWTLCGAYLRRYLQEPRHLRGFNFSMAALLIASILPLLTD